MLVDTGLGDVPDANTTAAALHALGSMTRNLPVSETRLLSPADGDAGPAMPDVVNLLFALAHRYWPGPETEAVHGPCRACSQIVQRCTGLLQDLTASDTTVRSRLRQSSSAAAAWIGVFRSATICFAACSSVARTSAAALLKRTFTAILIAALRPLGPLTLRAHAALCQKTSWDRLGALERHLSLLHSVITPGSSGAADDNADQGGALDAAWAKAIPCLRQLDESGRSQARDEFTEAVRELLQQSMHALEDWARGRKHISTDQSVWASQSDRGRSDEL